MMVDQKEGKSEYNQWRPDESKLLIERVASCVNEGLIDPNGRMFKKTVEANILSVLNEKFNSRKTYKHYINRMKILKNQYRDFVNLLHFDPKFEWNPITKKFTAPDEVWNAYLRDFPNQRHLRYETFEEYENMKLVFGKNKAMRSFEISLSQSGEVGQNNIPNQEVDLGNDNDHEVHEIGETATDDDEFVDSSDDAFSVSSPDAPVAQNDTIVKILAQIRSILSATKKMLNIMQERSMVEENKKTVWDAITEIPDLSNRVQYKALTMIQKLKMRDVFVNMSIEDRLGWIQCTVIQCTVE